MQKKIIALALAAVAGSAAAQTNVTVYGIVDLGQAFVKSSGATNNGGVQGSVGRLDSNSSYIGFKGVEDLGNGLKALFQYETGFDGSNAGALSGGRDTYVGLTGGFGTVVAGNLTHPLRAFGAKVELVPAAAGFGSMASVTGKIANINTGADDRAANAIAYVSPSFGGFTGTVAYVNGENKTSGNGAVNQKQWQVAAQYENGPLFVGAGYHKAYDFSSTAQTTAPTAGEGSGALAAAKDQDASVIRVAAVYTLPTNTKLTALYDRTKVDNVGGVSTTDYKRNAYSLGVAQSFGKNTVGLEYAKSGDVKVTNAANLDNGAKIWTAVYSYELSKRTSVHARYSRLSNDAAGNTRFYNNPVANGVANGAGADYSGYMVGLRHAF